jgi:hypothetical protein
MSEPIAPYASLAAQVADLLVERQAFLAERDQLREAARALIHEGCRQELGAEGNYRKCWKPAEFVLWGKLIPPEGLGPRCYDHAVRHVGYHALAPNSDYALMDLRPVRAVLGEPVPEESNER